MTQLKQLQHFLLIIALCSVWGCKTSKNNMVHLSELRGKASLTKGQQAYYDASVHGSVGYTASVSISNEKVLKLVKTTKTYKNPKQSHMSGGDAATRRYIFEAIASGLSTVIIKKAFRGELQNTHRIDVEVKEK